MNTLKLALVPVLLLFSACGSDAPGRVCEYADGRVDPHFAFYVRGAGGSVRVDANIVSDQNTAGAITWVDSAITVYESGGISACGSTMDASISLVSGNVPATLEVVREGVVVSTQTINALNTPVTYTY